MYAYLVQHSPAAGYRVARAIGKPVSNTYKAIEALQRKGAVLLDETNRLCRAAIWSRSPFLCIVFGSALGAELLASRLQLAVLEHWPDDKVRQTIVRFTRLRAHELPAFRRLSAGRTAARRP